MRTPEYLSPSSINLFDQNQDDFYLKYLADDRPPREPQNAPMAIGSAFDAYVKSYLHDKLFGKGHVESNRFDLDTIFEAQVEEQCRTLAKRDGKYAFEQYRQSGALADLLGELNKAKGEPRFEFELRGTVNGYRDAACEQFGDVVLLGKPDASYVNRDGVHVLLDWKVNGFYSNWPPAPMPGYVKMRGGDGKNYGCHKNCNQYELGSMTINIGMFLEHSKPDWANQLAIYAWLCGEPIGGDFIVAVDQLVCKSLIGGNPSIKVAEHRLRIHSEFQKKRFARAYEIWDITHSDHIFRDMTLEDSQAKCWVLDQRAEALYGSSKDEMFNRFTNR